MSEVPTEALIACGASLFWGGGIPRLLTPAVGDAKLSDGVNASITNTQNISPNHTQSDKFCARACQMSDFDSTQ